MTKNRDQSVTRVSYTAEGGSPFWVERVPLANVTRDAAHHVIDLVVATYSDQFEAGRDEAPTSNRPLSPGAVALKYVTADALTEQHHKMWDRIRGGGAYWVVAASQDPSDPDVPFSLDGLVNTTPSRETLLQRLGMVSPNCYVGNVLVRPERQGENIASAALHAALKYDGYDPRDKVALDSLTANPRLDDFYRSRGFLPEPDVDVAPIGFSDGQSLPQMRYSGTIGNVITLLEGQIPMLAAAVPERVG